MYISITLYNIICRRSYDLPQIYSAAQLRLVLLEKMIFFPYIKKKRVVYGGAMAIIDDLKQKTEAGLKTLKEAAQDIAFNVEKHAIIGKKKYLDIAKLQRNIQKMNTEIGEYVYDQFTSEKSVGKDDPFIKDRITAITRMRLSIKDIEEEIETLQKTQAGKYDVMP